MSPRSYLFVPADRPERIAKALASGADAVIVDLEDAVAPPVKPQARQALARWLDDSTARDDRGAPAPASRTGPVIPPTTALCVRINSADTPWFDDDLRLCAHPGVVGIMVSKAQRGDELAAAQAAAPGRVLLPLIETAVGLQAAATLATSSGVQRLVFGSLDFQLDLGIDVEGEENEAALLPFRSQLVLASRLAGLAAPVDGVSTVLDDPSRVERDTHRARRLGFGGKLCIHPRQVAAVHRGFAPSSTDVAWAERVLQAFESAPAGAPRGAVAINGHMVDGPVLKRAQGILERVGRA